MNEERRVLRIPAQLLDSYRVSRCVGLTGTRALNNAGDSDSEGDAQKRRKLEGDLGNVTLMQCIIMILPNKSYIYI